MIEKQQAKGRYAENGSAQFKKWCKLAGIVKGKEDIKQVPCVYRSALV